MNKTHRIVWSAARQAYIVAHEHATACGKPASTRAAAVLVAGLLAASPALANTCVNLAGSATIRPSGSCSTLEAGQTLKVSNNFAISIDGANAGLLENAGVIEGNGSLGAIHVDNATLDGLRNQATGSITGTGTSSVGLLVHYSASVTGIANSGIIQGEGSHGISVDDRSTINAFSGSQDGVAFLNVTGARVVGGSSGAALQISRGSTVNGDIVNEGTMTGGVYGLNIQYSTVNGNIVNGVDGVISGDKVGVQLDGVTLNGMIDNYGDIKGGVLANLSGLLVTGNSTLNGVDGVAIRNSGTIMSDVSHALKIFGAEPILYAASANNGRPLINGDIINDTGGVLQSGTEDGIALVVGNADINGNIVNHGRIEAEHGAGILLDEGTRVQGAIRNTNSLIGGIELNNATLTGGIDNAGLIEGYQSGIGLYDATVGGVRIGGTVKAYLFAIALQGNTNAGGLALQGQAGQTAVLEGKGYSVLMLQDMTRSNLTPLVGGVTLAGYSQVNGDMYTPNDSVTVKGVDNRVSGALEVQAVEIVRDSELVLESLNSTSARHEVLGGIVGGEWLPKLADALKSTGGVANNGRLVLAKADSYRIIGDYNQAADATLAVRATSDTAYSKLKVEGTAKLASGSKIAVDVRQDSEIAAGVTSSNTLFNTNRLAGVIQADTLESDGQFTVSDNSALFNFSAEKTGNNVDLVLKKSVNLEQIVKDNKGSVPLASQDAARVLDKITDRLVANGNSGAMAPVIDALGKLGTQTELAQAVEQLTPALPSAALSAVSDSLGAINRVVQARVEGNIGLSSGDELSAERYVWVKPFGSYAKQDARSETAGFKANTGGLVFGADAAISPKLRLGAALAYAHSDVDGKSPSAPQSSKVDVYQLIGYGSVQLDGNTEFNFQLDGGRNRNQGERRLPFMGLTASSDYDSLSYHLGAGVGRTFALQGAASTTPSLRLDYTRIKEDGYSETGAGAAGLVNGKRSVEQTLLAVDNRVTLPLNERQSVALNAGAAYDLMDDGAALTSVFAGEPGAVFSTESAGQSRWLWRAGLGYTYKADTGKGGLELTTRLDGEWRKGGYSNATASVKARYAF